MPRKKSNLTNPCSKGARRMRVKRAHESEEQIAARNAAQRIRTAEIRRQQREQRDERLRQNTSRTRAVGQMRIDTFRRPVKESVGHPSTSTSVYHVKSEYESVPSNDESAIEELQTPVEEDNKEEEFQFINESSGKIWNREDTSFLEDCLGHLSPSASVCHVKSECESIPSKEDSAIEELPTSVEEENKEEEFQFINGASGKIWNREDTRFLEDCFSVGHPSPRATVCQVKFECKSVPSNDDSDIEELKTPVEEEKINENFQFIDEASGKIWSREDRSFLNDCVGNTSPNTSVCHVKSDCESTHSNDDSDIEELQTPVEEEKKDESFLFIDEASGKIWNREDTSFLEDCIKKEIHQSALLEDKGSIPETHFELPRGKTCRPVDLDDVRSQGKFHKCHMCSYSTITKRSLKAHIDSVHLQVMLHKFIY